MLRFAHYSPLWFLESSPVYVYQVVTKGCCFFSSFFEVSATSPAGRHDTIFVLHKYIFSSCDMFSLFLFFFVSFCFLCLMECVNSMSCACHDMWHCIVYCCCCAYCIYCTLYTWYVTTWYDVLRIFFVTT